MPATAARLRIHTHPDHTQAVLDRLNRLFTVVEVSRPYPDRPPSTLVRIYLTIHLIDPDPTR